MDIRGSFPGVKAAGA